MATTISRLRMTSGAIVDIPIEDENAAEWREVVDAIHAGWNGEQKPVTGEQAPRTLVVSNRGGKRTHVNLRSVESVEEGLGLDE